jgi:glutathione-regulated potassium-efflux system ancillary protein KefG
MPRVLILFAHPVIQKSRTHRRLIREVPDHPDITFRDLYELYPDFQVQIPEEKALLAAHDIVVWQHPVYWYGMPPLLKQWVDLVLQHGWAYGKEGTALAGKKVISVVSTGGSAEAYTRDGFHRRTLEEFFAPIERTATLCRMEYLKPWVVWGTNRLTPEDLDRIAGEYGEFLLGLAEGRHLPEVVAAP